MKSELIPCRIQEAFDELGNREWGEEIYPDVPGAEGIDFIPLVLLLIEGQPDQWFRLGGSFTKRSEVIEARENLSSEMMTKVWMGHSTARCASVDLPYISEGSGN